MSPGTRLPVSLLTDLYRSISWPNQVKLLATPALVPALTCVMASQVVIALGLARNADANCACRRSSTACVTSWVIGRLTMIGNT